MRNAYFDAYVSNTLAGSGNQSYFTPAAPDIFRTGRIFYRLFAGGCFPYSLLYSNIVDSTFSDGGHSHCNVICDGWEIASARAGIVADCGVELCAEPACFYPLTFGGQRQKTVAPGEFFSSDPLLLSANAGDYLCVELTFRGGMLPCHPESLLPCFLREGQGWAPSKEMPFPGMIGCQRPVEKRVGFLGDSITQGIGVSPNSYTHWNARLSQMLGTRYSFWNLGLGFGRAQDAASDGAWLYKAKRLDAAVVCYGVNDLCQGREEGQIQDDLRLLVLRLQKAGVRVLLQTVPPFDYAGEKIARWHRLNQYILETLAQTADGVFDVVPLLGKSADAPHLSKYGGHPGAIGCAAWAEALYPVLARFLDATPARHSNP